MSMSDPLAGTKYSSARGPETNDNPKIMSGPQTFATGVPDVLRDTIDDDGDGSSSFGPQTNPNGGNHGTPAGMPDPNAINRGYTNTKQAVPSTTNPTAKRFKGNFQALK